MDNEIVFNEALIEEREQAIEEIQQQIGEVHEVFKDLATLVHAQGVIIGKFFFFTLYGTYAALFFGLVTNVYMFCSRGNRYKH